MQPAPQRSRFDAATVMGNVKLLRSVAQCMTSDTDMVNVQEAAQTSSASSQGLAWRVKSQLTGVKTVTVSAPGVLLEEWSPEELQVLAPSNLYTIASSSSVRLYIML